MVYTLEKLENIHIYGYGELGHHLKNFFESNNMPIKGIIDSNKSDCLKIENIENKNATIIIASINYMYEIEQKLLSLGFKNVISFAKLTLMYPELQKFNQAFDGLKEDYIKNKDKYDKLYNILADEKSKKVLNTIIEYRKTFDTKLYSTICDDINKQYFEEFMPKDSKIFVDGGGYDGDTVQRYLKYNTMPEKIYFFEPDSQSIKTAKENLKAYNNIEYLECGVSDKTEYLKFDSRNNLGSLFSEQGDCSVKCVAIDDIVKEDKAFIKLDVEGFEIPALYGAKRLIKNGSPLAICVYHKPEDIWKIPEILLAPPFAKNSNQVLPKALYDLDIRHGALCSSKCKIYLRHYTTSIFETVLYIVPNTNSIRS